MRHSLINHDKKGLDSGFIHPNHGKCSIEVTIQNLFSKMCSTWCANNNHNVMFPEVGGMFRKIKIDYLKSRT